MNDIPVFFGSDPGQPAFRVDLPVDEALALVDYLIEHIQIRQSAQYN